MNLIKSAYQEGIINLRGSGSSKFDLLHVDDLYEAIKLILDKDIKNEIINLGCGEPISINELASTIVDVLKNEFNKDVKIVSERDKDYKEWPDHWMSINKAKRLLNWEPKTSLLEGVKGIIQKIK